MARGRGERVLRKYSRTFFERFHARLPVLVDELSRSMEPEIGVTCDESQGGCGCRGGCRGMFIDVAWPPILFRWFEG